MRAVATKNAPNPVGPYSQGVAAGGFFFTAGQIGLNPETGKIVDGLDAQVEQALKNTQAVLAAAGLTFDDVVKATLYVTDLSRFADVNAIYGKFLGAARPARSTVGVPSLPGGALFEVDTVAVLRSVPD
jgi:2-iminobutanoate/2-iminopropanoate deaminase